MHRAISTSFIVTWKNCQFILGLKPISSPPSFPPTIPSHPPSTPPDFQRVLGALIPTYKIKNMMKNIRKQEGKSDSQELKSKTKQPKTDKAICSICFLWGHKDEQCSWMNMDEREHGQCNHCLNWGHNPKSCSKILRKLRSIKPDLIHQTLK